MKWIKASSPYYHVTHTNLVDKILQEGIRPMQTSNWSQGENGERYGDGEVYAMDSKKDAIKLALNLEGELYPGNFGDGNVSIIEFDDTEGWEQDFNDPSAQNQLEGRWLKRLKLVKPENIINSYPVGMDEIVFLRS